MDTRIFKLFELVAPGLKRPFLDVSVPCPVVGEALGWSEEENAEQRVRMAQSMPELRRRAETVWRIVDDYLENELGEGTISSIWLIGSRAGQINMSKPSRGVPTETSDWDWLVVGEDFDAIEAELCRQYDEGENTNHPIFKRFEGHDLRRRGNANDIVLSSTAPQGYGIKVWPSVTEATPGTCTGRARSQP